VVAKPRMMLQHEPQSNSSSGSTLPHSLKKSTGYPGSISDARLHIPPWDIYSAACSAVFHFSPTAESRNEGHSRHAQSHHMQVITPALHLSFLPIQDTRYIAAFLFSATPQTFPARVNLILKWNTEDVAFLGHLQTRLVVCEEDERSCSWYVRV